MKPNDDTLAESGPVLNPAEQPDRSSVYEAPVLIPLGNVHALLAGHGNSVVMDGNVPGSMRLP